MDLKKIVKLYSLKQLSDIKDNFAITLLHASQGKPTSLSYLKTPLPTKPLISKPDTPFQVMVIGGTQFQSAIAYMDKDNRLRFDQKQQEILPKFDSSEKFLEFIASKHQEGISILTINFAYELDPTLRDNQMDGSLVIGGKENALTELVGKQLGLETQNHLQQKLARQVTVTIANDTTCLALTRLNPDHSFSKLCIGIVGTGYNLGFFFDENTFINLEAKGFDQFTQTPTGELIDQHSEIVGDSKFEKEVSGAYLYQHYNHLIDQTHFIAPILDSTDDLTLMAGSDEGEPKTIIAQLLFQRSASLVAAQITGLYEFKAPLSLRSASWRRSNLTRHSELDSESIPKRFHKLTFIMEGSLFWKGWHYQQMVEEYLLKLGVPEGAIEFIRTSNSSLTGAAKLALQNYPKVEKPKPKKEEEKKPPADHGSDH